MKEKIKPVDGIELRQFECTCGAIVTFNSRDSEVYCHSCKTHYTYYFKKKHVGPLMDDGSRINTIEVNDEADPILEERPFPQIIPQPDECAVIKQESYRVYSVEREGVKTVIPLDNMLVSDLVTILKDAVIGSNATNKIERQLELLISGLYDTIVGMITPAKPLSAQEYRDSLKPGDGKTRISVSFDPKKPHVPIVEAKVEKDDPLS